MRVRLLTIYAMRAEPLQPYISITEQHYTGGPQYTTDGDFLVPNPGPAKYTGVGPEVDAAWEELIQGPLKPHRSAYVHTQWPGEQMLTQSKT